MLTGLSDIALRIANLEKSGALVETTASLLQHHFNDIAGDLDALQAKIEKFSARIDAVEHDAQRAGLMAAAQRHFDNLISEIKSAARPEDLEGPRKVVETFDIWKDERTDDAHP